MSFIVPFSNTSERRNGPKRYELVPKPGGRSSYAEDGTRWLRDRRGDSEAEQTMRKRSLLEITDFTNEREVFGIHYSWHLYKMIDLKICIDPGILVERANHAALGRQPECWMFGWLCFTRHLLESSVSLLAFIMCVSWPFWRTQKCERSENYKTHVFVYFK